MITSKQRSFLKGMAQEIEPSVYIGKNGLTDNIMAEIDTCLEHRELIKVKIQDGSELKPKDVANQMALALHAEFVQAIGKKFIIYRESKDYKTIELPKK